MAGDEEHDLRALRRLAKLYDIVFRGQDEEWPESHRKLFQTIQELGSRKFRDYSESVSARSLDEPWTRQTKSRAQWIVSKATHLAINVHPNENGWRIALENDILRRFLTEVAWYVPIRPHTSIENQFYGDTGTATRAEHVSGDRKSRWLTTKPATS
jgi:hypothetical protein